MGSIKYLERHVLSTGQISWGANPSKAVREALLVKYESYNEKKDAVDRCMEWEKAFLDYKRGIDRKKHISENSVNGLIAAYKYIQLGPSFGQ